MQPLEEQVPPVEPTLDRSDAVPAAERLPMSIKLAYGMPNFAGAAMVIPIAIHMNFFYSDVVLVPLGYIALAVALARSLDAITDPLMGWISDRTNTRWGRRRPWMVVGAPLAAIAFVALFTPPESLSTVQAAVWFTAAFGSYFLFHTVYVIPHYGLGPELTQNYHERSSLFAVMEGFTLAGTVCASALPGLVLFPLFGGQRGGFLAFSILFGTILVVLYFWQCYRIKERPDFYQRKPNPLIPGVRRVMRNRPFRILLATYVVGSIAGAIPGLMMPYFTTYVLRPEDPQRWIAIFLLVYFLSAAVTLPLWVRATRRFGKYAIYIVSALMGVTASFSLFFMGEGDIWPTFAVLVWAGAAVGVRIFLGPSIQADVIDYDELYTGKRREAQYGALWAYMTKFIVIPSAAVPLAVLAWLGYVPNVDQTETVRFAISAIFGLVPATTGLLSLGVFLLFPIREQNHRAILAGIARHAEGEPAEDPLTGRMVSPPVKRSVSEDEGWFLDHFSVREQRLLVDRGSRALVLRACTGALVSLGLLVLFVYLAVQNVGDLSQRPGLTTTFEVVGAGFSLTALLYHIVRIRAALGSQAREIPARTVRLHLEDVERLKQ